MFISVPTKSVTPFDVIVRGKIVATFATYAEAYAFASTRRGAMIRYFIKK